MNNIDNNLKNDIYILIINLWLIIIIKWFALVFKMKIYNQKIVFWLIKTYILTVLYNNMNN
jgi:hypothetical protein